MKHLIGYKTVDKAPDDGDLIYSLRVQRISAVRKFKDGSMYFPIPGFKGINKVDEFCIVIEKSNEHKIEITDHDRKVFKTILMNPTSYAKRVF
jgi:hypothetical protein